MVQSLTGKFINEYKSYPLKDTNVDSLFELKAPENPPHEETRFPLELCLCVDTSGSMSGDRIENVKKLLRFIIKSTNEKDKLSIVIFSDYASVVFKMNYMTKNNKEMALNAVRLIRVDGCTNMEQGLRYSMDQFSDTFQNPNNFSIFNPFCWFKSSKPVVETKNTLRHLFLLTDGHANRGLTGYALVKEISDKYKSFKLQTFGFGSHDAQLLKDLSDTGNGAYYSIPSEKEIGGVMSACLGGIFQEFASSVSIKFLVPKQHKKEVEIEEVLTSYPLKLESKHEMNLELPDIQYGEERDFVIKLKLKGKTQFTDEAICIASVTYFNREKEAQETKLSYLKIERKGKKTTGQPNMKVDEERERITSVKVMEKARKEALAGRMNDAKLLLQQQQQRLISVNSASTAPTQQVCSTIGAYIGAMESTRKFKADQANYESTISGLSQQRSTIGFDPTINRYQTRGQERFRSKYYNS